MKKEATRLKEVVKTIEKELGEKAHKFVTGNSGYKRWGDEFMSHVNLSMHLGRVNDAESRKLIRAIIFLSAILYDDIDFSTAVINLTIKNKNKKRRHHDLRTMLGDLWVKAIEMGRDVQNFIVVTNKFLRSPINFARDSALTCSSDTTTGFSLPPERGRPKVPSKPLLSTQRFHGNWNGALPPANRAGQSRMYIEAPGRRFNMVSIKTLSQKGALNKKPVKEFPAYFLPWISLKYACITLPNNPTGNPKPVFMTSGLSGCSVFIKGPPQTPTVYHIGVVNDRHGKVGAFKNVPNTLVTGLPARIRAAYNRGDSVLFWRELFKYRLGHAPNTNLSTIGISEVNKDDYQDTPRLAKLKNHIGGAGSTETIGGGGFVFGIWENNKWGFYLQEKALLGPPGRVKTTLHFPVRLTKVYPLTEKKQVMINVNPPKHKLGIM